MKERIKREIPLTGPISHSMIMSEWGHSGNFKLSANGAAFIGKNSGSNIKESDFRGQSASNEIINKGTIASVCQHGGSGYDGESTDCRIGAFTGYQPRTTSSTWYQYYKTKSPVYMSRGTRFTMSSTGARAGGYGGDKDMAGHIGFADMKSSHINNTNPGGTDKCSTGNGSNPNWNLDIYSETPTTHQGQAMDPYACGKGQFVCGYQAMFSSYYYYWMQSDGNFFIGSANSIPASTSSPPRTYSGNSTPGQSSWQFGVIAKVNVSYAGGRSNGAYVSTFAAETV